MCKMQVVLGLIVLYVGFAHSWDLAVTHGNLLEFYTNETKTNTVRFNSHNLGALAYDEVHNMLLYVDKQRNNDAICGHDISSQVNQCFIERNGRNIHGLSFDPVTELLFFSDTKERSINWISLKSGSNKYGNLLIKMDQGTPTDIAVESCRGYIYWINQNSKLTPSIERARFDGSEREVIIYINTLTINTTLELVPHGLTIDQQTQKIYWIEPSDSKNYQICYADLNGKNKIFLTNLNVYTYEFINLSSNTLTVSKTSLFVTYCLWSEIMFLKMGKNTTEGHKLIRPYYKLKNKPYSTVANYKIKELIQDNKDCDALMSLERKRSDGPFCVHGVKVSGQSVCKCAPGYIGERCELSICENYCLQGNCSVNHEGLPKCRCNDGYSGEQCGNSYGLYCVNGVKVIGQSVCKCAPGYIGERCDLSICENYCLQGNCSVNDEGLPKCRCNDGYSGERCEENSDGLYCVNGVKVVGQSVCTCAPGYIGERCDLSICENYCLKGNCSVNDEGLPNCRCNDGYSGERCEENSDRLYCVNGVNVVGQSVCTCAPGYIGERCDLSICENYCLKGNCSVNDEGFPKCRCNDGYSGERCGNTDGLYCVNGVKVSGQSVCKCAPGYIGERCDLSICENYCLQGICNVNDEGLPKCRCNDGYSGERCEENSDRLYCVNGIKVSGQSVCKCAPGYIGERCDLSICENYCLQGICSVNDEGLPKCRCNAGYSGERCEVNSCYCYCLNNGVCSLNEEDEPSCECVSGYRGSKCEVFQSVTFTFSNHPAYSGETNPTLIDLLSNVRKNTSKIFFIVDES